MSVETLEPPTTEVPPADPQQEAAPQHEVDPAMKAAVDRWLEVQGMAKAIASVKRKRDRQETKVAEAKATLETERDAFNKLVHEVEEMQEEMDRFAAGGHKERLFTGGEGEATASNSTGETPVSQGSVDDDSWKADKLDVLEPLGLPAKIIEKMQAAGLNTLGDVHVFLQPNATGYTKALEDINGIGKASAEKYTLAMEKYWEGRKAAVIDSLMAMSTDPLPARQMTLAELGITDEQLKAATHEHLLTQLAATSGLQHVGPMIENPLFIDNSVYIAVPFADGKGSVCRLIQLFPVSAKDSIPDDKNPYTGGLVVTKDQEKFVLGDVASSILVVAEKEATAG